ncbi:MAG: metal-dependent hydrolase [Methylococcaceae bacterium]|nr:metal-dependent hydrolase [Methylococcaceae bacterium]
MTNGVTHSIIGGLSGLAVSIFDTDDQGRSIHNPVVAVAAGTFFGTLPDILEPALRNPHHRQFSHSFTVLVALGYGLKKVYKWQPKDNIDEVLRGFMLCAGVAYISHLLLDASTPRSLPLLGKIQISQ